MKIISIKGKNVALTDSIVDTISRKLVSLEKLTGKMEPMAELVVEVGKSTKHHKTGPFWRAEAMLQLPGKVLRAESTNESLYASIDLVKDELSRQIKQYKDKLKTRALKGGRKAKEIRSAE
ncbi:MAG: ribosome-associated translation inhibitor RaiA [bacterium]|nr:ribosome-associated translation inhibitor RaiA [bacterium]